MEEQKYVLVPADEMKSEFNRILLKQGFSAARADQCAEIFMNNSLEGVYSHGVNRFPRFVSNTRDGYIKPDAEPELISVNGAVEQLHQHGQQQYAVLFLLPLHQSYLSFLP